MRRRSVLLLLRAAGPAAIVTVGALAVLAGPSTALAASAGGSEFAKLTVRRADVKDGRLKVLASITKRADGDRVGVDFIANGKRSSYTARARAGRVRVTRRLPASQRRVSTGIVEVRYRGSARVRSTKVRLRAAAGKARLRYEHLSIKAGILTARGSVNSRARGAVKLVLSYVSPAGTSGEWRGRARIQDDGRWGFRQTLPSKARSGGFLSIQFSGSTHPDLRGEQLARKLLGGQSFGPGGAVGAGSTTSADLQSAQPSNPPSQSAGGWRAPGSPPLSDGEAAARVRRTAETRLENVAANAYRPSAAEIQAFLSAQRDPYGRLPAEYNPALKNVTGDFAGTTDEILQWAAHKWGIPGDLARAVAVSESRWRQGGYGDRRTVSNPALYPLLSRIVNASDVYESLGLMQVKWRPDGSAHTGTEPLRWKSTAFNVDFWAATVRYYYDGECSWCDGTYAAGQEQASIGAWYSPSPWNNAGQQEYAATAWDHAAKRTWAQSGF
jgi:autotransporter family porin